MDNGLVREDSSSYFKNSSINSSNKPNSDEINVMLDNLLLSNNNSNYSLSFHSPNSYSKNDFEVIELLGKGAYAKVVKALCTKNKEIKAIKIIDRNFIEKENKLYQIYIENDILQKINHSNIIKLEGIFEENSKIFMVLEYLPNGDFYEFLKTNSPLKHETIQYYTAQLVNTLEYLHQNGIAHRDLKPENLMLDQNYRLKFIDFATSKIKSKVFDRKIMKFVDEEEINSNKVLPNGDDSSDNIAEVKNTFVGTAEYVSPEVLVDKEAGSPADLWALGCILYQMYAGNSPFKDKTEYLIFKKILDGKFFIPDSVPEEAKNLISALLKVDPLERLGSGSEDGNNYNSLKTHPYFKGLDMENINKYDPPFKNEFKTKVVKSTQLTKSQSQVSSSNVNFSSFSHRNTIMIIKQDVLEKKSPWFHYNTRKVVLDNSPKIEYIDPFKNIVKGTIYLNKSCYAKFVDNYVFELYTPKRVFKFKTTQYESGVWAKTINETIEKFSRE